MDQNRIDAIGASIALAAATQAPAATEAPSERGFQLWLDTLPKDWHTWGARALAQQAFFATAAPAVGASEAAAALKQLIGSAVNYPKTPRSAAWVADVFARIDALAAVGASVQPVQASLSDAARLDHLQQRGATVEVLPGDTGWRFRIGGMNKTVRKDIREAIDAVLASSTPTTPPGAATPTGGES